MGSTLDRVRELADTIAARADEIERARRIPRDLFQELVRAGCLRMQVPAARGGDELELPEQLRVIEALARADASVGWTVSILAATPLLLAHFPESAMDEVYASGPDVAAAGALAPKGTATHDGDGWRVTGRWPFASGCNDATWIYAHCVLYRDGEPQLTDAGAPTIRMMLFPAEQVKVIDTWHALGLRGTGSHDIRINRIWCSPVRSCALFGPGAAETPPATAGLPLLEQLAVGICAVAVGIAGGAVDDLVALVEGGKRPAFSQRRVAESPLFQTRLGETYMTLQAARGLLMSQTESAWARACAGVALDPVQRATLRATASRATAMAADVVDAAYTLAGGSAVYDDSPLQRRLRDVHAVTQHAVSRDDTYPVLGGLLVDAPGEAGLV